MTALFSNDPETQGFEFHEWGYPTRFSFQYLKNLHMRLWADDPDIRTIGQGLRTFLNVRAQAATKLMLVGHSMGGLVIQAFIIEEVLRGAREHLDRLTEVVLYGTPSGGLLKARIASLLKNQIADMNDLGPFITKLRSEWQRLIDDQRADPARLARFRLTLIAGMSDTFVPQESSLSPFVIDEKEIVPGDHGSMIKPVARDDVRYLVLRRRLLRGSPTQKERELVLGESQEVVQTLSRIEAAVNLHDLDYLLELAGDLLVQTPSRVPLVERELGLRLLDFEQYEASSALLGRYLNFRLPDDHSEPFRHDEQVLQQLAIARSGLGDVTGSAALLVELNDRLGKDAETQGILAGRFKRQWRKNRTADAIGWRAFDLYYEAFTLSGQGNPDTDQRLYNGINAAYLEYVLGGNRYRDLAREVLKACELKKPADYWSLAAEGEAYLLLEEHERALAAYQASTRFVRGPRYVTTTGQQALHIIRQQGDPEEAGAIKGLFGKVDVA